MTGNSRECYGPPVTPGSRASDHFFTVLLVLAMVGWAGTWTSGKLTAGSAPIGFVVFARFALTTVSLVPVLLVARESFALPWKSLPSLLAAAAAMTAYNRLFFTGMRLGLAGSGGVIAASLSPVLTLLATRAIERRRPGTVETAGVLLGFAGGAVLLRFWRFSAAELAASGNLFFVLASASWVVVTLASQRAQRHVTFFSCSFHVNALSAALALPWALSSGLTVHVERPAPFWLNIAYLALVGTSFSTTVYFRASHRLGAQRASSFMFLVPALAPLIAWLVMRETPEQATLLGGPLAVAAVYLINRGGPGPAQSGSHRQGIRDKKRSVALE